MDNNRHEHSHETNRLHAGPGETPAVYSTVLELEEMKDISLQASRLERSLKRLAESLSDKNAFIGHIKAFAETAGGGCVWLSTT
ncbi:MAG: hypothetical protein HGA22_09310, partial [Clostridiales bacterium]|nr:hypothetical protein [Clostridiales bacterium]